LEKDKGKGKGGKGIRRYLHNRWKEGRKERKEGALSET
jgi:hypothetical protein